MSTSPYVYTHTQGGLFGQCWEVKGCSVLAVWLFSHRFTGLSWLYWALSRTLDMFNFIYTAQNHKVGFSICKEYDIVCPPTLGSSDAKKTLLSGKNERNPRKGHRGGITLPGHTTQSCTHTRIRTHKVPGSRCVSDRIQHATTHDNVCYFMPS